MQMHAPPPIAPLSAPLDVSIQSPEDQGPLENGEDYIGTGVYPHNFGWSSESGEYMSSQPGNPLIPPWTTNKINRS